MDDVETIASGPWTAGVNRQGARLEFLRHHGTDVVVPAPPEAPGPGFHGAVIGPWPNRVADGRWSFRGVAHHVPVNEPVRATAVHGFTPWERWTVGRLDDDRVSMALTLAPRPGWPHLLALDLACRLRHEGLELALTVRNDDVTPAQWGATIHPYLCPPHGTPDDWTLLLPADHVLEVTPDRLLPTEVRPVGGSRWDLRRPVPVAGLDLDHAFTGLVAPTEDGGLVRAELRDATGAGVHMSWSPASLPWVQVYTGDACGVAIEPMTCPPDALNSGVDVVVLEPGGTHRSRWLIGVLTPPR